MIGADPRFMLVDDDPDFHEIFGDFLALALPGGEYELACFNDPDAAVEALHDRYYTTVFVDYRLGATTGIEFIRNCQLGGSHAPRTICSGTAALETSRKRHGSARPEARARGRLMSSHVPAAGARPASSFDLTSRPPKTGLSHVASSRRKRR